MRLLAASLPRIQHEYILLHYGAGALRAARGARCRLFMIRLYAFYAERATLMLRVMPRCHARYGARGVRMSMLFTSVAATDA